MLSTHFPSESTPLVADGYVLCVSRTNEHVEALIYGTSHQPMTDVLTISCFGEEDVDVF